MTVSLSEVLSKRSTLTLSAAPDWSSARYNARPNLGVHLAVHDHCHQAIFDTPDCHHCCTGRVPSRSLLPTRQLLGHTYHSTTGLRGFAVVYQSSTRQYLVDVGARVDTTNIIGCKR